MSEFNKTFKNLMLILEAVVVTLPTHVRTDTVAANQMEALRDKIKEKTGQVISALNPPDAWFNDIAKTGFSTTNYSVFKDPKNAIYLPLLDFMGLYYQYARAADEAKYKDKKAALSVSGGTQVEVNSANQAAAAIITQLEATTGKLGTTPEEISSNYIPLSNDLKAALRNVNSTEIGKVFIKNCIAKKLTLLQTIYCASRLAAGDTATKIGIVPNQKFLFTLRSFLINPAAYLDQKQTAKPLPKLLNAVTNSSIFPFPKPDTIGKDMYQLANYVRSYADAPAPPAKPDDAFDNVLKKPLELVNSEAATDEKAKRIIEELVLLGNRIPPNILNGRSLGQAAKSIAGGIVTGNK